MATFVWSNFGGSCTGNSLYDISADFRTGLYHYGTEIGTSTSVCSCGGCQSCEVHLSNICGHRFKMSRVDNLKDSSKRGFCLLTGDFYRYLHESLKEIYGAENVIVFGRNIVIKKPSIDVKEIFSLFERKAIHDGYVFGSSPLEKIVTHFPLQLDAVDRERLIKFISTPGSSVGGSVIGFVRNWLFG